MPLNDLQKDRIARDVRARYPDTPASTGLDAWRSWNQVYMPPLPADLACWQPEYVKGFFAEAADGSGRPTDVEVAVMTAAAAYGPAVAGPPPDALLEALGCDAQFDRPGDERAIERILVRGVLLPPVASSGRPDWDHAWSRSWEVLYTLICRRIHLAVRWIGRYIKELDGGNLEDWAERGEVNACSAMLTESLIQGCNCWHRWSDFRIRDEISAMRLCATQHQLESWNRTEPLDKFLIRALLHDAKIAQVNASRKGMLAKAVADGELMAGPVLRCSRCGGEIRDDDSCARCRRLGRVEEPSWWLWLRGQRNETSCRRCMRCKCLYFQWKGRCPDCQVEDWSDRPTRVWAAVHTGTLEAFGEPEADRPPITEEAIERLEEPQRTIALRLFRDGWDLEQVAAEQECRPEDEQFKRRVTATVADLAEFFSDEIDTDELHPPGGNADRDQRGNGGDSDSSQ
jgi:hypothetical protein